MPPRPRARPDLTPELLYSLATAGRLYTVALQGFSEFERRSLGAFFRLVSDRTPAYQLSGSVHESDFVVSDAEQPDDAQRIESTVYIGLEAPPGALARLPRPIDPVNIVRALDSRVSELETAAATLREAELEALESDKMPLHDTAAAERDDDPFFFQELADLPIEPATSQMALPLDQPASNWEQGEAKDVLVVDDSNVALRFLEARLHRLGYRVHPAHTGAEALALLEREKFCFVFFDLTLGQGDTWDGLQLCRHVKQQHHHTGKAPPIVVIVSAHVGADERLRGEFAGCDAYLTKPLDERALVNTLGRHDATFGRPFEAEVQVPYRN